MIMLSDDNYTKAKLCLLFYYDTHVHTNDIINTIIKQ